MIKYISILTLFLNLASQHAFAGGSDGGPAIFIQKTSYNGAKSDQSLITKLNQIHKLRYIDESWQDVKIEVNDYESDLLIDHELINEYPHIERALKQSYNTGDWVDVIEI